MAEEVKNVEHGEETSEFAPETPVYPEGTEYKESLSSDNLEESIREAKAQQMARQEEGYKTIFELTDPQQRKTMGSLDLINLLRENNVDGKYSEVVRNSASLLEFIETVNQMPNCSEAETKMRERVEKGEAVDETEIPPEIIAALKEMIVFAVNNGSESLEMVGDSRGFDHAHLGTKERIDGGSVASEKINEIAVRLEAILGHTQELKGFDKTKRNVLFRNGEISLVAGMNEQGTTQLGDLGMTDQGSARFYVDDSGKLSFYFG